MRMVKTPNWPADRFKAFIDRILDETGLNKAQLAALLGINPSQISRWTNGAARPRFETLVALGQVMQEHYPRLGISPLAVLAAAGYSSDSEAEAAPEADRSRSEPAALEEDAVLTPSERVMKDILKAVHKELRALNEKIDDLAARDREREEANGSASEQKGA